MLKSYDPAIGSQARKTLMEGFETIKCRINANKKLESAEPADFGGFTPAPLIIEEELFSLDTFIRKRMGGERDGLIIKWHVRGADWVYYPWTGNLVNESN